MFFFASLLNYLARDPLLPQIEIDPRKRVAGDPRVEEGVGDVEGGPLDGLHHVAGVADHLGEGHLADLGQLRFWREKQYVRC